MTEVEWLCSEEAWKPLIHVREYASVRKLRLVAAAYVRWLQSLPEYKDARHCADLIEEVADTPLSHDEIMNRLYGMDGSTWGLTKVLGDERVGQEVSKLVFFAQSDCIGRSEDPNLAHRKMIELLGCVFGSPFRTIILDPAWLSPAVVKIAEGVYDNRDFGRMPSLGDALEEAGCTNQEILGHCRQQEGHVRGCWVVDPILGKS